MFAVLSVVKSILFLILKSSNMQTIKITKSDWPALTEVFQANSIRWMFLYQKEDGTFENTGPWIKCRDYFNDVAVAYNGGPRITVYGLSTVGMKIPPKGEPFHVLLKGLTAAFYDNIKILQEYLDDNEIPNFNVEKVNGDGEALLTLDPYFMQSTYHLSLITLMLRLANDVKKYESWEEFRDQVRQNGDGNLWNQVKQKNIYFNLPATVKDYYWFAGSNFNSKKSDLKPSQIHYTLHNNGVISWMEAMVGDY